MNKQEIREQEEVMEKPYTLRRLVDRDLFPILRIIGEVFPDDLAKTFMQVTTKEKSVQEVGAAAIMKMVIAILKNMDKVQEDVYNLLSDVSGIPAADIQEMEFGTTPMMIWDIVGNEKNCGFFKVLSKLS
jgi:hypothetical protein